MEIVYVGVGEYATTQGETGFMKTLALGSCVAVIVLDPDHRCLGLLHVALPDSTINQKRALERPGMFADTGIAKLLESLEAHGYEGGQLTVKLAGGASIMDPNHTFDIGNRNVLAIRKCLWKHKLGSIAEDVGGNISRSVSIDLGGRTVVVSSPGRGEWVL